VRDSVARVGAEFRNGIVPEWEGVTGLSFVEDFMGVELRLSSILGIGDL
jgi:hypothetical protein